MQGNAAVQKRDVLPGEAACTQVYLPQGPRKEARVAVRVKHTTEVIVESIFALTQHVSYPFLRIALGVVLLWIGALHLVDPSPVVGLLGASLPFLAFNAFVYILGAAEVSLGVLLFLNVATQYVGVALVGLFSGTLLIFLVAPMVAYGDMGFPFLALPGEFLLKDLVLMAAAVSVSAMATARDNVRRATPRVEAETARAA